MELEDNIAIELRFMRIGFGDGKWEKQAHDCVQLQASVLAVLNLRVLLKKKVKLSL
jgi:hypothetical protein